MCYICKKNEDKHAEDKNYCNARDHCHCAGEYRRAAHCTWNLKCNKPKEIPIVSHNGSNYDYHFIIKKKLAKEFEKQWTCLGENT